MEKLKNEIKILLEIYRIVKDIQRYIKLEDWNDASLASGELVRLFAQLDLIDRIGGEKGAGKSHEKLHKSNRKP